MEIRDSLGKTALTRATESGNVAVVKLLLEWGANRDVAGINGETAYQRAVVCDRKIACWGSGLTINPGI